MVQLPNSFVTGSLLLKCSIRSSMIRTRWSCPCVLLPRGYGKANEVAYLGDISSAWMDSVITTGFKRISSGGVSPPNHE